MWKFTRSLSVESRGEVIMKTPQVAIKDDSCASCNKSLLWWLCLLIVWLYVYYVELCKSVTRSPSYWTRYRLSHLIRHKVWKFALNALNRPPPRATARSTTPLMAIKDDLCVVTQTSIIIGSRQYSRIMEFITSSHGGVKLINNGFAYTKKTE